jgi:hypothetical protein
MAAVSEWSGGFFVHHSQNSRRNMLYEVLLGIDHAGRDTKRRMRVKVAASDRLEAAIVAEKIGDSCVREPAVEYTHAMKVWPLRQLSKLALSRTTPALAPIEPLPAAA